MKNNSNQIFDLLKEEYEKRIDHYLNLNEIEVKDKDDNDLIASAKGLKVKDKAGFLYTVINVIEKGGEFFVRLLFPGEGLDSLEISKSYYQINEKDKESKKTNKKNNGDILPPNKKVKYKKSFSIDINSDVYDIDSNEEYLDVPIKEFEDNFSL